MKKYKFQFSLSILFLIAVILFAKPAAAQLDFTWTGICMGAPTIFTPSGFSQGAVASYYWSFGDGGTSTLQNTSHVYITYGNYPVTFTITDTSGVSTSIQHIVIIQPPPISFFSSENFTCALSAIQFTSLSITISGYITLWHWEFGDGTMVTIPFPNTPDVSHIYSSAGTFVTTLTVTSNYGCIDSFSQMLTLWPGPEAFFSFSPAFANSPVQFTDASTPGANSIITGWQWDFGDPSSGVSNQSTIQNPQHIYANPGNYNVKEIVWNDHGCPDTLYHTIAVNAAGSVFFNFSGQCAYSPTQFTAITNGITVNSYTWDFGDGTTGSGPNPSHSYAGPGTYNVQLTVLDSNGITYTSLQQVVIHPIPVADFSFPDPACAITPTVFTDMTYVNPGTSITQWSWEFGDPASGSSNTSILQNPTHSYTTAGNYLVRQVVTDNNGCKDTLHKTITVVPLPVVDFTTSPACTSTPVLFTPSTSVMNVPAIAAWNWNFGDGSYSTVQSPVHQYALAGTYTVTLTVTDTTGCSNSTSKSQLIWPAPVAGFNVPAPSCAGNPVNFFDLSQVNGGGPILSWLWNFGDPASGTGNTSTQQNPVHIFSDPGNYQVLLIVTNSQGCLDSLFQTISVNNPPQADFTFSAPAINQPVLFTDLSTSVPGTINGWTWNFGDGSFSNLQNPTHAYSLPGSYTVVLTASTGYACASSKDSILIVPPGAGGVNINGRVMAGGSAIASAEVRLIMVDPTGLPLSILLTEPGTDTYFHFDNLPQGTYYLHANPLITGPFSSIYLPTFYQSSLFWETASQIVLGQPQNPYDIYLQPYTIIDTGNLSITGQLIFTGKSVSTEDQEILLLNEQGDPIGWTFTGQNGNFHFDNLPSGTYGINPVIVGFTTYPYYVALDESNSPLHVNMFISGTIITGLSEKGRNQPARVYPNPAKDLITLELPAENKLYTIELINADGNKCKLFTLAGGKTELNLQGYSRGLYLLRISSGLYYCVQRIVLK